MTLLILRGCEIFVSFFLITSCTNGHNKPTSFTARSEIRGFVDEPVTLDWTRCGRGACLASDLKLSAGLIRTDPQNPFRLLPALAESWDNSGKTIQFKIRSGIRWSNGEELTASHFLHSSLQPEALDRYTLTFRNHHGSFPLHLLTHPSHWARPSRYKRESAGTVTLGPYYLQRWNRRDSMEFSKNPYYQGNTSSHLRLQFSKTPLHIEELIHSELHFGISELKFPYLGTLLGRRHLPNSSLLLLLINPRHESLRSRKAREALANALDKQELADFLDIQLLPTDSFFGPHTFKKSGRDTSAAPVFSSLWRSSKPLSDLSLGISNRAGPQWEPALQNLRAQWAAELSIQIAELPPNSLSAPLTLLSVSLEPSMITQQLSRLYREWLHPAAGSKAFHMIELIEQLRASDASEKVETLARRIETFLIEESLLIPLGVESRTLLFQAETPELSQLF